MLHVISVPFVLHVNVMFPPGQTCSDDNPIGSYIQIVQKAISNTIK